MQVQRVQVLRKGKVATTFHREPCAGHREVSGEASAAACAGQAIEPRNTCYSDVPRCSLALKATLLSRSWLGEGRHPGVQEPWHTQKHFIGT